MDLALLTSSPARQKLVQVAHHVADLDAAMRRFHRAFGVGPFLLRRHVPLQWARYRGAPAVLDISVAHAQWGSVQLELVVQHGDAPSAFRDAFAAGSEGLHHVAIVPEEHDRMVAHHVGLGFPALTELMTPEGRGATYVDTRAALGHMLEIYRPNASLQALYARVAAMAEGWDGRDLVIEA